MSLQALQDRYQRPVVFKMRLKLADDSNPLGKVTTTAIAADARIGQIELAQTPDGALVYDMLVFCKNDQHFQAVRGQIAAIGGVEILSALDTAMEAHRGGSCEMRSRGPIRSNTDLRMVYTPGVARVCKAIEAQPALARQYTGVANKVAIATNGTAILGLGDIGCLAGLPVMEGKSAIFAEFAKISAEPVLIQTKDADEFINVMEKLAVGFGAIQVEDVAAPECFRITRELDNRLSIPVMHDDQHGTATVVTAGLISALKRTGRKMSDISCVMSGAGAAGTAIADLLVSMGIADVVLCDRVGALYTGRAKMNTEKDALALRTNKGKFTGTMEEAFRGRNLFIGVSQANIVNQAMVKSMAKDPIIFALANPISEISQDEAMAAGAAVYADGRMINNALAYPGIFRGALDCGCSRITVQMVVAAAKALADHAKGDDLMPEMMDPATHEAVAKATVDAAGPGDALVK